MTRADLSPSEETFILQTRANALDCSYNMRRQSFKEWPHIRPSAHEMALNGFACLENDRACCTVCYAAVDVDAWVPFRPAAREHRRLSPYCPVVRGAWNPNLDLGGRPRY